ncbi:MAG: hypothetical protein MI784_09300, partial [Cytophagales bacterium]|nr:hypothetical protein [Cytophagales bacterium]
MRRNLIFWLYFFSLLFISEKKAGAQDFPVQASVFLNRPYSPFLSDYTVADNNKVLLNLWLKDLDRTGYLVKLRIKFRGLGSGVTVETSPQAQLSPITLDGGSPEQLMGVDLAEYFDLRNLLFSGGMSKQEYLRSKKLKEGLYIFSVDVLDFYTNRVVSNHTETMAWLILNDGPLLNLPEAGKKVEIMGSQAVQFVWTPRHTASPNSIADARYKFELFEHFANRSPEDIVRSAVPLYEEEVFATSLFYGMDKYPLEPGKKYVWRVKAFSPSGADLFKNQGYSEARVFQFGDRCLPPRNLVTESFHPKRASIRWIGRFADTGYRLRYRKKDSDRGWMTEETITTDASLKDLKPGSTYEYQISTSCGVYQSERQASGEFRTAEQEQRDFTCGVAYTSEDLKNMKALASLKKGDIVYASDFEVEILEVSGGGGSFTGKGKIIVPFFNRVNMAVSFDGVMINTDYRLVKGEMNITGAAVELMDAQLVEELKEFIDVAADVTGKTAEGMEQFNAFYSRFLGKMPKVLKKEMAQAGNEVKIAKRRVKAANKELARIKKMPESELKSKRLTEAKQELETAEKSLAKAKKRKSTVRKKITKAIVNRVTDGAKVLLTMASGVNRVLQMEAGPMRKQKAEEVMVSADKVLEFLTTLDGKEGLPKGGFEKYQNLLVNEKLKKIGETLINAQKVFSSKVEGYFNAIQKVRVAVWTFKQLFGQGYEKLAKDSGEQKIGEGWSETHTVTFQAENAKEQGFDNKGDTYAKYKAYYTEILRGKKGSYWVPWASAEEGRSVTVGLSVSEGLEADKLTMVCGGESVPVWDEDGVALPAGKDKKKQTWQAVLNYGAEEQETVGELNVVRYPAKTLVLKVVPVSGNPTDKLPDAGTLREYLNRVYGCAQVSWTVSMEKPFEWNGAELLDDSQTGGFANYNGDMKALISAYRKERGKARNGEFVLFWGPGSKQPGLAGYMPLKRRYGFIFSPAIGGEQEAKRTIAHELGHGAFRLEHTWDLLGEDTRKKTDNLMDYNGGEALYKWQWDLIQDPVPMIAFAEQEDEDGKSEVKGLLISSQKYKSLSKIDIDQYAFLTPNGKMITLPDDSQVSFTGLTSDKDLNRKLFRGALLGFKTGGKAYSARFIKMEDNYYFKGYYFKNNSWEPRSSNKEKVLIGVENKDNCEVSLFEGRTDNGFYQRGSEEAVKESIALIGQNKLDASYFIDGCGYQHSFVKNFVVKMNQVHNSNFSEEVKRIAVVLDEIGAKWLDEFNDKQLYSPFMASSKAVKKQVSVYDIKHTKKS